MLFCQPTKPFRIGEGLVHFPKDSTIQYDEIEVSFASLYSETFRNPWGITDEELVTIRQMAFNNYALFLDALYEDAFSKSNQPTHRLLQMSTEYLVPNMPGGITQGRERIESVTYGQTYANGAISDSLEPLLRITGRLGMTQTYHLLTALTMRNPEQPSGICIDGSTGDSVSAETITLARESYQFLLPHYQQALQLLL